MTTELTAEPLGLPAVPTAEEAEVGEERETRIALVYAFFQLMEWAFMGTPDENEKSSDDDDGAPHTPLAKIIFAARSLGLPKEARFTTWP